MGRTFIVNAPMIFTGIWAIVKNFLDERTRSKFTILGYNYEETLLEHVDAENLPDFLGGTCKCEEHGGCLVGGVGPW